MTKRIKIWALLLALSVGCYFYSKEQYAASQRKSHLTEQGWETKNRTAKIEADEIDADFSADRLAAAQKRAREANTWVHPYSDWLALRKEIESKYMTKDQRPVVAIKSYVEPNKGAPGGPSKCYVTVSFDNMDDSDASFEIIRDVLALMDKSVQGCQRVELNLAPPLADGAVPTGAFVNSKAVYQFNVIGYNQ